MHISPGTCAILHHKSEMALEDAVTMSGALPLSSQTWSTVSYTRHEHQVAKQPMALSSRPRITSDKVFYCRYRECKRRDGGGAKGFLRKDNRNTHEKIHERAVVHGNQERRKASALPPPGIVSGIAFPHGEKLFPGVNGNLSHVLGRDHRIAELFEMSGALN